MTIYNLNGALHEGGGPLGTLYGAIKQHAFAKIMPESRDFVNTNMIMITDGDHNLHIDRSVNNTKNLRICSGWLARTAPELYAKLVAGLLDGTITGEEWEE